MTNIYKVPCYIEFEVEGELVPGSLKAMSENLLNNLAVNKKALDRVSEVFDTVQSENKSVSITIKQYELPKEFIKAVISLL